MELMKNKKGQAVGDIPGFVILLVLAAVVGAVGQQVLGDIKADFSLNSYEYNGTVEGQEGVNKVLTKLSIIGTVIAAVIIIGLLVRNFRTGQ